MKKYLEILKITPLFDQIDSRELTALLHCLGAMVKSYQRDEVVLLAGDPVSHMGLVLQGSVQIFKEDFSGNRNMLARAGQGELFAEVFVCVGVGQSPVTVVADAETEVLFIDFRRIVTSCSAACGFHTQLVENMLRLMARKNMALNEKVSCIGHRTTREKVEAFLALQAERMGQNPFEIAFSRAEMADYLCVDRSALSAVLGKMQSEGVLRYRKNRFELLGRGQM